MRQILYLVGAGRFIAIYHQAERRMVAIFPEYALAFFLKPAVLRLSAPHFCPSSAFYLQVDT